MNEIALMEKERQKLSFPQQAAKYSCYTLICVVAMSILLGATQGDKLVLAFINIFLVVSGLLAALFALCCIPRNGTKGILGYAIIGLILNGSGLYAGVSSVLMVRAIAERGNQSLTQETAMEFPPVFMNSETVFNERLGYSFEVPKGFQKAPNTDPAAAYTFIDETNPFAPTVFMIQDLPWRLPPNQPPLNRSQLRAALPPGAEIKDLQPKWQALNVRGFRAIINKETAGAVSCYSIQIPISKQAIQLQVIGPTASETGISELSEKLLQSIHGKSNWTK